VAHHNNRESNLDSHTKPSAETVESAKAERAVADLLRYVGEEPERDGLKDTPARVAKSWREMTRGYHEDPATILGTTFCQDDCEVTPYRDMVVLRGIEMNSLCEHHCLPFVGEVHVVYIPGDHGRIVGISKLARLVDCFARRLQVQERLTAQIVDALEEHLQPLGAMAIIEASHSCMRLRGVQKQHATMITSAVRGVFKTGQKAKEEALALCGVLGSVLR
jgi:GTP cyclohydrolase I